MKTIFWYPSKRRKSALAADTLHIEAEGCIVNIRVGLTDSRGRKVTAVSILPDDETRGGDGQGRVWRLVGAAGARVVRLNKNPKNPRATR